MTIKDPKRDVEESGPEKIKGEGSEGADSPESNERTVPLSAHKGLQREHLDLKARFARLEGVVEGFKAGQPKSEAAPPPEQVFTRAQLRAAIAEGKITEDQMDAVLEKQARAEIKKEIAAAVSQTASVTRASATIETELGRYIEAHPDLMDQSSDLRAKVQAEYDYLLSLGDDPKSRATELKAVRAAVGPLNANKGRKKEPETHQETGGGAADDRAKGDGDKTWFKGLTPRQKSHYETLVTKGVYKGFNDALLVKEVGMIRARGKAH